MTSIITTIREKHLKPVIFGAVILLAYIPTFMWMWARWMGRDSYYSHGVLVPFITAFLIWHKRDELVGAVKRRCGWGIAVIAFGLLIHFLSALFRVYFTSGFSFLIVAFGFVLFFYGPQVMRLIAFPVFFLFFMIPLPLVAIINISFRMKLLAATIAAKTLNGMGLQAIQQGSIIIMRHAQVVVDDVCSGLRSLISLTALGSIFAYWMSGAIWKRVLLFLSTFPIAIITNVCRVVLLSAVSEIWGPKYAEGFIHDASGFMIFGLAFVMLWGVMKILE